MKIVILEPLGVSNDVIGKLAEPLEKQGHSVVRFDTLAASETEQVERGKDADVLIIANHPLSGAVIAQCEKLQYISVAFVGTDHIDQKACIERGIKISNAAGYCDDAVAELTLGLALDCLRNISTCNQVIRQGGTKAGLIGHELRGKTVGIIGTGRIGRRSAQLFRAFGCNVLGYSRSRRKEALELGISYVGLEELLAKSDIVSVHTPLTEETKGLLGKEELAMMKPSAVLLNTSRGPVVDSEALADALNAGRIAAAGVDVFDEEPPLPEDNRIIHAKNTVLTPHIAFATEESIERRAAMVFENVEHWLIEKSSVPKA